MEQFNGDNGITSKSGSDYVLLGLRPHVWITSLQILFSGMTSVRDLAVSHLHWSVCPRRLPKHLDVSSLVEGKGVTNDLEVAAFGKDIKLGSFLPSYREFFADLFC